MTGGRDDFDSGARPGVRANALPAAAFSRLRVVDSRLADAILDVLEDAGVAAYVEPSAGEMGVYRDVRAHRAPSDELFVDAARRDVAMVVLEAELPGMLADLEPEGTDPDEAFAAIIAGFHEKAGSAAAEWPTSEDTTAAATDTADNDDDWYTPAAVETTDEEHYVPPPPLPLPRLAGAKLWGLVMLVGGFVLMGALPMLGFEADTAIVIGIATTAAGAATLVWRMRDTPPDPDDGAVV